jgi:hypothetical protein
MVPEGASPTQTKRAATRYVPVSTAEDLPSPSPKRLGVPASRKFGLTLVVLLVASVVVFTAIQEGRKKEVDVVIQRALTVPTLDTVAASIIQRRMEENSLVPTLAHNQRCAVSTFTTPDNDVGVEVFLSISRVESGGFVLFGTNDAIHARTLHRIVQVEGCVEPPFWSLAALATGPKANFQLFAKFTSTCKAESTRHTVFIKSTIDKQHGSSPCGLAFAERVSGQWSHGSNFGDVESRITNSGFLWSPPLAASWDLVTISAVITVTLPDGEDFMTVPVIAVASGGSFNLQWVVVGSSNTTLAEWTLAGYVVHDETTVVFDVFIGQPVTGSTADVLTIKLLLAEVGNSVVSETSFYKTFGNVEDARTKLFGIEGVWGTFQATDDGAAAMVQQFGNMKLKAIEL